MIRNQREYRITRAQVEQFERALADMAQSPSDPVVDSIVGGAVEDGMRSQLADLKAELAEYDSLRSGRRRRLVVR